MKLFEGEMPELTAAAGRVAAQFFERGRSANPQLRGRRFPSEVATAPWSELNGERETFAAIIAPYGSPLERSPPVENAVALGLFAPTHLCESLG